MIDYLRRVDRTVDGQWLLKIASWWYPTLPVCRILGGPKCVTTVDIGALTIDELFSAAGVEY
jgi:hypothetical protein